MRRLLTISAAPLLLLLVATIQIYCANARTLTPWKGGGFGMFSSVDSGGARELRAWLQTPGGGEVEIDLPDDTPHQPWVGRRVDNLRAMPSETGLRELAEDLAALEWIEPDPPAPAPSQPAMRPPARRLRARYPDDPRADRPPEPVRGVRLELWRVTFDADADRLHARRWMSARAFRGDQ